MSDASLPRSGSPDPQDDIVGGRVIEYVRGLRLHARKKQVMFYLKFENDSEEEWESLEDLEDSNDLDMSKIYNFQSTIDHLNKLARLNFTPQQFSQAEEEGQDEYEVEQVLGVMVGPSSKSIEYYIKWRGWDHSYNNWEVDSACSCPDFTGPYEDAVAKLAQTFKIKKQKAKVRKRPASPRSNRSQARKTPQRAAKAQERVVVENDKEEDYGSESDLGESPPPSKRPGPKSRTLSLTGSLKSFAIPSPRKKPGPKSKTMNVTSVGSPNNAGISSPMKKQQGSNGSSTEQQPSASGDPSSSGRASSQSAPNSSKKVVANKPKYPIGMVTCGEWEPKDSDESSTDDEVDMAYLSGLHKVENEDLPVTSNEAERTNEAPPAKKRPGPRSLTMPKSVRSQARLDDFYDGEFFNNTSSKRCDKANSFDDASDSSSTEY